ncbi:MAG: methylated-DNA--[protein]-cysteine S-methyltransferase [Sciscionella sp.]
MSQTTMGSPIGRLQIISDGSAVTEILFCEDDAGAVDDLAEGLLAAAVSQLKQYFAGELQEFDLALAAEGTPFQRRVWAALRDIPYGATASYGEIARRLGMSPAAARAVGHANSTNPIPIVVPCHRVIGADGSLTGYAGGLHRKEFLLHLEGSLVQPALDGFVTPA